MVKKARDCGRHGDPSIGVPKPKNNPYFKTPSHPLTRDHLVFKAHMPAVMLALYRMPFVASKAISKGPS